MNIKEFFQSKTFRGILYGVGIVVVILLVFQAGVFVGYHKASFSYRSGEKLYRMFDEGQDRRSFMGMSRGAFPDTPNTHGTIGKIIKLDLPTLVVEDKDKTEKIIIIKDDTTIRRFREEIKSSDLKMDDFIVVVGTPNADGQVEARLVRVMPTPPKEFESGIKPETSESIK
jgi:hypothetical protein